MLVSTNSTKTTETVEYYIEAEDDADDSEVPVFVESASGRLLVEYKGHRYGKRYKSKRGTRWVCSVSRQCNAFLLLNHQDEIILGNTVHEHEAPTRIDTMDEDQNDTAVVITSRKGKEMLLFRQYTYRKQYEKFNRSRWVCSNLKNCRASVFTDNNNYITSVYEQHCHPPPKYYRNPSNVIGALREPLIVEEIEQ